MTATPTRTAADVPGAGDLYRVAVEEYRFQAQFNWSRTQYFLAFNAAILAAAVALSGGRPAALVFGLGAVAAVLSASAVHTQPGTTEPPVTGCGGSRTSSASPSSSG